MNCGMSSKDWVMTPSSLSSRLVTCISCASPGCSMSIWVARKLQTTSGLVQASNRQMCHCSGAFLSIRWKSRSCLLRTLLKTKQFTKPETQRRRAPMYPKLCSSV